jgi:hypothetical protein
MGDFLVDGVKALRKEDSHRLIQVYLEGADHKALEELKTLGCMIADGGSQYPETFGGEAAGFAEYGLQRRAEEVSVGNWSAMFPTQLDATLFTMLLGGGANANIKMFIPATKSFDELRRPTHSLDRFEKFVPIWNELRATRPMPREVFTLFDRNGQLLDGDSTQFFGDSWANAVCMEAGIPSPWVPLELAVKGKLMFLPRITSYEEHVLQGLADYVQNGGTLIMCADAGRKVPEVPEEDWVLLRKFGFRPPSEQISNSNYIDAVPVSTEVFTNNAKAFRLRDFWSSSVQEGEQNLAVFQGDGQRPAITWRSFGKGRVVVVWASTIVPAGAEGYPLLRDLARWAGVSIHAEGSPASFWTNLVKHSGEETYYGLVYRSGFPGSAKEPAAEGVTRWFLPEGKYQITELINGRDIGVLTSDALKSAGLPAKMTPYEVAIYRIEKKP